MPNKTQITFTVRANGFKQAGEIEEILQGFDVEYTTKASAQPVQQKRKKRLPGRRVLTRGRVNEIAEYVHKNPKVKKSDVAARFGIGCATVYRITSGQHKLLTLQHKLPKLCG